MARQGWVFFDPVENESMTLPINPLEAQSPSIKKSLTTRLPIGVGGRPVIFEGARQMAPLTGSGTILEEDHIDALYAWMSKPNQIKITDDLDREFWVYLESFEPKRQRSVSHPWRHEYVLTWVLVDVL